MESQSKLTSQEDGATAWTLENSRKFWQGCAFATLCPEAGLTSQEQRADEVDISRLPVAPNLQKKEAGKSG